MSAGRFAPITSALLARKGDAAPSLAECSKLAPRWNDVMPAASAAPQSLPRPVLTTRAPVSAASAREKLEADSADHPRRIVLSLSPAEHEKLGIAAVKKGLNRNQLVRAALESYLDALIKEYRASCACLGSEGGRASCCSL